MQQGRSGYRTIGVLAGWQLRGQLYGRVARRSFTDSLLRGIQAAARDYRCNVLVACGISAPTSPTATRPAWPVPLPDTAFVPVGPWNTDGLIIVHPLLSEERSCYIRSLIQDGHPVVYVGTAEGGPAVGIDNEGGIRQAIAHLVEHGHRAVAFIAGQPMDSRGDSGDRLQAYWAAVHEYGLVADPNLVAYGLHIFEGGQQAMRQLLDSAVEFTAVMASNDESALGAIQVLRESGWRVPEDIAVIGFDDQYESAFHDPPLSTVRCSIFERGYRAFELLWKRLEGQGGEDEIIRVPTHLVIRQSCGCPPHSVIPAVIAPPRQEEERGDRTLLCTRLGVTIAAAVRTESQQNLEDLDNRCCLLAEAFLRSLDLHDSAPFDLTLQETLRFTEELAEDVHIWQAAISVLNGSLALLREKWPDMVDEQFGDILLHQARILVSESAQRQYRRTVAGRRWESDQLSLLTTRLLRALDKEQIFSVLGEHLPHLGVQRLGIAFFEPAGADLVAWSNLRLIPGPDTAIRFPSREFPPPGLYLSPFSLVLLPLEVETEGAGFAIFDMENLDLCGAIVWQLAEALRSARLYQEATEGRRLAEEANRLKSRFLSMVSHELRTPLSLIVGLSQTLLREKNAKDLSEAYRQDIQRIQASAQQLDGLIRDVLDLARSEAGQLRLTCEPLDLREVLETVAMAGEQMAREKGLVWRSEIPADLPLVWGDRLRLRQVVLNLIGNAVKFTEQGEVALQVKVKDEEVIVSVSDTGLGIPPEEQQVIFDEFRQSERTLARGYGGLGLGLAICKRLVELHGGRLGVHSSGQEGAGSTFYFTLPVVRNAEGRARGHPEPSSGSVLVLARRFSTAGLRLREHLVRQGFAVELMWMEEQNVWLPHLISAPPGAVVVDTGGSAAQGWDILKTLKDNPTTRDIPVVFYTLEEGQEIGSVLRLDYLTKPVGTAELVQALEHQGLIGKETSGKKTILIVDDEPAVLEMHARIVQAQSPSYRVLQARNGRQALEIIQRERPDLILLDLIMPELDGFGVLEALQQGEATRTIPVIVLTGQELTEEDMARLNRGVTAVLRKGLFSVEETLRHIEQALSRQRKLGSAMQRLVRKAMAYIHEHYAEPLSLRDVGRRIGVSDGYLVRCFQRELGVTPMEYLNRYRVNQAKILLTLGDMTITEIASRVGFADGSYFSRVFREETGLSPSEYRRRYSRFVNNPSLCLSEKMSQKSTESGQENP